jgi:hypothetical protein
MAIADADISPPGAEQAALLAYEHALEDLVRAAQALYEAWGRVLVAEPPEAAGVSAHLAPAWAERILREADDPEVVQEALLAATHALSGIADEMYAHGPGNGSSAARRA